MSWARLFSLQTGITNLCCKHTPENQYGSSPTVFESDCPCSIFNFGNIRLESGSIGTVTVPDWGSRHDGNCASDH